MKKVGRGEGVEVSKGGSGPFGALRCSLQERKASSRAAVREACEERVETSWMLRDRTGTGLAGGCGRAQ